ncbi:hypothetical protein HPG69_016020 [Diceros bicornis minor]|uniref:Uncharacterized protein n=1 Tax=Diceros bicornis minor TaxID=77932 RepID=A0A7J7FE30_DICBM|nr:hypothetical protein HPG69_016020 [Diceros bicornis minor]
MIIMVNSTMLSNSTFLISCRMDSALIPSHGNDTDRLCQYWADNIRRSRFCHSRLVHPPAGGFWAGICHLPVFKVREEVNLQVVFTPVCHC